MSFVPVPLDLTFLSRALTHYLKSKEERKKERKKEEHEAVKKSTGQLYDRMILYQVRHGLPNYYMIHWLIVTFCFLYSVRIFIAFFFKCNHCLYVGQ